MAAPQSQHMPAMLMAYPTRRDAQVLVGSLHFRGLQRQRPHLHQRFTVGFAGHDACCVLANLGTRQARGWWSAICSSATGFAGHDACCVLTNLAHQARGRWSTVPGPAKSPVCCGHLHRQGGHWHSLSVQVAASGGCCLRSLTPPSSPHMPAGPQRMSSAKCDRDPGRLTHIWVNLTPSRSRMGCPGHAGLTSASSPGAARPTVIKTQAPADLVQVSTMPTHLSAPGYPQ